MHSRFLLYWKSLFTIRYSSRKQNNNNMNSTRSVFRRTWISYVEWISGISKFSQSVSKVVSTLVVGSGTSVGRQRFRRVRVSYVSLTRIVGGYAVWWSDSSVLQMILNRTVANRTHSTTGTQRSSKNKIDWLGFNGTFSINRLYRASDKHFAVKKVKLMRKLTMLPVANTYNKPLQ